MYRWYVCVTKNIVPSRTEDQIIAALESTCGYNDLTASILIENGGMCFLLQYNITVSPIIPITPRSIDSCFGHCLPSCIPNIA